jgi:hypothetical protein
MEGLAISLKQSNMAKSLAQGEVQERSCIYVVHVT